LDCKLYLHPENGETQLNLSASSGARNSKSDIGCQALFFVIKIVLEFWLCGTKEWNYHRECDGTWDGCRKASKRRLCRLEKNSSKSGDWKQPRLARARILGISGFRAGL